MGFEDLIGIGVPGPPASARRSTLRTIVDPSAPRALPWYLVSSRPRDVIAAVGTGLFGVGLLVGFTVLVAALPLPGSILLSLAFAGGAALARVMSRHLVLGGDPKFGKVRLEGEGLRRLEEIDARFAYAERMIGEVPTGLDWSEISTDVRAILWEAAACAAKVTTLDKEIHELRYAAGGTPQAALKRSLEHRRDEFLDMLTDFNWEAEALARVAGNAAAAAKVALLSTGSLAALEVAAPSVRAIAARDSLAEARIRLEFLAEAWAQLDESNTALAEQLRAASETESRRARSDPERRA